MTTNITYPIPFDEFYSEYITQLAAPDRPTTYIAYCRTEAQFATDDYPRRYANHETFKVTCSKNRSKKARINPRQSIAA